MIKRIVFVLGLCIALIHCSKNQSAPLTFDCSGVNAEYTRDIAPIIQQSCAISGCHDANSTNAGGPFTNFSQVKNRAQDIKGQVVNRLMPQNSSLDTNKIKLIACWVDSGAPSN